MTTRSRALLLIAAAVLLTAVAAVYTVHAAGRQDRAGNGHGSPAGSGGSGGSGGQVTLTGHGRILFRDTGMDAARDHVASVAAARPDGPRVTAPMNCVRFYAAAGTGVCLRDLGGAVPSYSAVILDSRLAERRRVPLAGTPSRARVSPSGRLVAWTVFVTGDSYGSLAFSTRTGIADLRTGTVIPSLEDFTVVKDGARYKAADINIWGVTFADDDRFYVTVASKGTTWLAEGSIQARRLRTLRENVECPSLSPDGTRLVFKKRVRPASSGRPWRLYALDLKTMRETPLAEERNVDDQAAWVGPNTVAYALPGDFGSDVWEVPADGTGSPRKIIPRAQSPVLLP